MTSDGAGAVVPGDEERLARVGLSRLVEPDDIRAMGLVADLGPVAAWRAVLGGRSEADLAAGQRLPGDRAGGGGTESGGATGGGGGAGRGRRGAGSSPSEILDRLRRRRPSRGDAHRDLAAATAAGARLVCPGDPEWPAGLDQLTTDRPLCLWLIGAAALDRACARAVAIVGSRAATGYGCHVAGELAHGLAGAGWTVVSGGAYGIDGAAHRGALAADGTTVAVLAGGVDVVYPRGHATLFRRIVESGVLIGERPPGSPPLAHRFLSRNRVIAALASGTVVVEAARRSGARRTADCAAEYGRELMAVPGPVTSVMSAGCHELLRDGAVCVRSAADVLEALAPLDPRAAAPPAGGEVLPVTGGPRAGAPAPAGGGAAPAELPPVARLALGAVPAQGVRSAALIAQAAGMSPTEARRALASLEVAGLVESRDGGYRLAAVERARRGAHGRRADG